MRLSSIKIPRRLEQRTILFVSSDRSAASVLEQHLSPEFEVHAAATHAAASALMDAYPYHCVVVDLRASGTTGIDLEAAAKTVITIAGDDDSLELIAARVRERCGR